MKKKWICMKVNIKKYVEILIVKKKKNKEKED